MDGLTISDLGLILIVIGFIIIVYAMIKIGRGGRGGGILLIGPIPIIWGSDKEVFKWLVIVGLIIMLLYFVFFFYALTGGIMGG